MDFALTSTSPLSSSLVLVSTFSQSSAGTKRSQIPLRPPFSPNRKSLVLKPSCFNLPQEPILSEAFKEPVAFVGGMFAGLLRLDLNEDPLKEWVTRTVEASGITEEEVGADGIIGDEEAPQQIEIE